MITKQHIFGLLNYSFSLSFAVHFECKGYAANVNMRSNPNTFLQLAESMFQFYVFVVLYCGNNWLLVHGQGKKYRCFCETISFSWQIFYTYFLDIDSERSRLPDVERQLFRKQSPSGGFSSVSLPVARPEKKRGCKCLSTKQLWLRKRLKQFNTNTIFTIICCVGQNTATYGFSQNRFEITLQCFIKSEVAVIFNTLAKFSANCPANIYVQNNYFYILSDNQTDANNAQSTCSSAGGTLAEIRNNATRSDFIGYAVRKHISSGMS